MVFTVTVDRDEDGVWVVECPSIPGCVSQGKTKEEALESIKDSIRLCLEVRAEKGLPLTIETRQVEVAGSFGGVGFVQNSRCMLFTDEEYERLESLLKKIGEKKE